MRTLSQVNECLLIKWWWRYGKEASTLWKQVVCSKYGGLGGKWNPIVADSVLVSNLWQDILSMASANPALSDFFLNSS